MTETDVLIAGAGISGLVMAMEARARGFAVTVLEKSDDIGGTWRENTYPGVACDIPSHLYSLASHPNPHWTRAYAGGAEIQAYLREVTDRENLRPLIRFGRTLTAAHWDGARWQVRTAEGETFAARVLVSAMGALHIPSIPDLPGRFDGPAFHSAEWRHDLDLTGKRVAVLGTGASAVQFVPEIAKVAAQVTVFQRSAPYVMPRGDAPIASWVRRLYAALPALPRLRRALIHRMQELQHANFRGDPTAVRIAMWMWRRHMEKHIKDNDLRQFLTPGYRIGCKRIMVSDDWYPALARPNVRVIPAAAARLEPGRVIAADGREAEADVVIHGTGFHVTDSFARLDVQGEGGRRLSDAWAAGLRAHLGTAVAGFPNLFFLLGPHTGLGHNSVVLMIEAQAAHVGRLLAEMRARGIPALAPRPEAEDAFEAEMDRRLSRMVWQTGGCGSWYQDATGRASALWPGTVDEYARRMAAAGIADYAPPEGAAERTEVPA